MSEARTTQHFTLSLKKMKSSRPNTVLASCEISSSSSSVACSLRLWQCLTMTCGRKSLKMVSASLAERAFGEIVEDHNLLCCG